MPNPRPICFMIMPYGTKLSGASITSGGPDKVNFNRLWDAALSPAIDKAGYQPVRADQDMGALIINEMIQRLAVSDLVLADVSIPNGNVYYEVGIRHAAKKDGCMITSAEWAEPLFDVKQMRQVRYPLPTESISDDVARKIVEKISEAIPKMSGGTSPFYEIFPDFPAYNSSRISALKDDLQAFALFQQDVQAARSAKGDACRIRALTLRDRYFTGGPIQKAVAIELLYTLRDCTDFQTTIDFIDKLPVDLRNSPLVNEQRALAQSGSGDDDTAIGGLLQLIAAAGDTPERRGLLGGRYKRKWNRDHDPADLSRAIAEYEKGMKLDLNNYYPSSNLTRLYRLRARPGDLDKAQIAAAVTLTACEGAKLRKSDDEWLNSTLLGAAFDAGDVNAAETLADSVETEGPAAWKLSSTLADCRTAASLYEEPKRGQLMEIVERLSKLKG